MDTLHKPKVCVIGCGISGILCIKYLKDVCDIHCYEMQDKPCGVWNYTKFTDETIDKDNDFYANMYGHCYGSVYENLTTVGPKNLNRLKDTMDHFEGDYFTDTQYIEYLLNYMKTHNIDPYISYNTAVIDARVNDANDENLHWKVTIQRGLKGETEIIYFDYVIVANGNTSIPNYNMRGIKNFDTFEGTVMHSHNFRTPYSDAFENKHILFIGSRISSNDILYQFLGKGDDSKVTNFKTITVSQGGFGFLQNTTNFRKYIDDGRLIVKKTGLDFKEHSVVFEDGTEQEIDTVIF